MNGSIFKTVLMTQAEASTYLGTTVGTLNTWRHYGRHAIPYVKWGSRIRYRQADLDAWIAAHTHNVHPNI